MPNYNGVWSLVTQLQYVSDWPSPPLGRMITAGGLDSSTPTNVIVSTNIVAGGANSIDFGDLSVARQGSSACASTTRACIGGGSTGGGFEPVNTIDYITIASTGNAIDFGDTIGNIGYMGGCADTINALFAGGQATYTNQIQFVVIATTANSTDFGDLSVARSDMAGCSSDHGGLQ